MGFFGKVKAVDAAIMNKLAPDKPADPPKIQHPYSNRCQMPTRAGGNACNKPKTSANADTCGRPECAKAWGQIHDEEHSTHPHATVMRKPKKK